MIDMTPQQRAQPSRQFKSRLTQNQRILLRIRTARSRLKISAGRLICAYPACKRRARTIANFGGRGDNKVAVCARHHTRD